MTTQNNMALENQFSFSMAKLELLKLGKHLSKEDHIGLIRNLNILDGLFIQQQSTIEYLTDYNRTLMKEETCEK